MKSSPFYAVGRCLVIVTATERNRIAKLLKEHGYKSLATKVRSSKVI